MSTFDSNCEFYFYLRIKSKQDLIFGKKIGSLLNNMNEMVFRSQNFNDYQSCAEFLNEMMSKIMTGINSKEDPVVLVSQINPAISNPEKVLANDKNSFSWELDTVSKVYLAKAAKLKKESILDFEISADIKVLFHAHLIQSMSSVADLHIQ